MPMLHFTRVMQRFSISIAVIPAGCTQLPVLKKGESIPPTIG